MIEAVIDFFNNYCLMIDLKKNSIILKSSNIKKKINYFEIIEHKKKFNSQYWFSTVTKPCALLKLDFLTSAYKKMHPLVRSSSFSAAQGLRETGSCSYVIIVMEKSRQIAEYVTQRNIVFDLISGHPHFLPTGYYCAASCDRCLTLINHPTDGATCVFCV